MTVECRCRCHDAWAGNRAATRQLGTAPAGIAGHDLDAPLDASDVGVREAAVACDACRGRHCPALRTPAPEPRVVPVPWVEPPVPAHGATDGSDEEC